MGNINRELIKTNSNIASAVRKKTDNTEMLTLMQIEEDILNIDINKIANWQRLAIVDIGVGSANLSSTNRDSSFNVTFPKPFSAVPMLTLITRDYDGDATEKTVTIGQYIFAYFRHYYSSGPAGEYYSQSKITINEITNTGFSGNISYSDNKSGQVYANDQRFTYRAIKW